MITTSEELYKKLIMFSNKEETLCISIRSDMYRIGFSGTSFYRLSEQLYNMLYKKFGTDPFKNKYRGAKFSINDLYIFNRDRKLQRI